MKFDEYTKLHEYIEYASEPDDFVERCHRLKQVCDVSPHFKKFFFEAHKPSYTFIQVLNEGPMDINCTNNLRTYAYGSDFMAIMDKLAFYADNSVAKPHIRYSNLVLELDEVKETDVDLILCLLRGDVKFERLNNLVVSEVFPELLQIDVQTIESSLVPTKKPRKPRAKKVKVEE